MKAALCKNLDQIEIHDVPEPTLGEGDLLIRVTHCGVCGSDIKKLTGRGLNQPQTLGHEVVGVIEGISPKFSSNTENFSIGDRVVVAHHVPCFDCHYCRHENYSMCRSFKTSNLDPGGFSEKLRIPASHVKHTTFKIPDELSDERALFTEPLACCLRCVKRLNPLPRDTAILVGFGSVGVLLQALLQRIPSQVIVLDIDPQRLEMAQNLGLMGINPKNESIGPLILEKTAGRGADIVLFTAGTQNMLTESMAWLRDGGSICLFSELSGETFATLDTQQIYKREITLLSSYSPGPKDLQEAFQLIVSGAVDLDCLSAKPFELNQLGHAMDSVIKRRILKAMICPSFKETRPL